MISGKLLEKVGLKVKRLNINSKDKEIDKAVNDFILKMKEAHRVTKNSKAYFKVLHINCIHTK